MKVEIGDKFYDTNRDETWTVIEIKDRGFNDIVVKDEDEIRGTTDREWLRRNCEKVIENKYQKDKQKLKL